MPSSAKPCPSKWQRQLNFGHALRQAMRSPVDTWVDEVHAAWMDAVSLSDWIMTPPGDPDYVSPYCMQGCTFT
jgi:hypothetical protein